MKGILSFMLVSLLVSFTWVGQVDAGEYRLIYPAQSLTYPIDVGSESSTTIATLANLSAYWPLTILDVDVIDTATGNSAFDPTGCPFVGHLPYTLAPLAGGQSQITFGTFECIGPFKGSGIGLPLNHPNRSGYVMVLTIEAGSERDFSASSRITVRRGGFPIGESRGMTTVPAIIQRIKSLN